MNVLEDNADFPVDYRTIQKSQLADKTTNVKGPKDWTVVKVANTPLLTYKGRIYLPPSLANTVAE
eukprot:1225590-Ditylum_brightwellii.AAC.1